MPDYLAKPKSVVELAARLSELGYWPVPIPRGCKGPSIAGWQNLRLTPEQVPDYFREGDGMLVGILHNNVLALDVDVYDADLSKKISDEALRRFPGALLRIGQPPKSAVFLRMEEPGFKVNNTEKHEVVTEDGEVLSAQVEVRSVSRQIVAYGVHPSTNKPYNWPLGELWSTPREDLPVAERGSIEAFRDWCDEEIRKWAGISEGKVIDLGTYTGRTLVDERPTEEQFTAALSHVSSNVGYDEWLRGLMAIHDFYEGSQAGLQVAHSWSSSYPDYSHREVETKWKSFEAGKGTSYKTIFYLAKMSGADMSEIARIGKPERTVSEPEPEPAVNPDEVKPFLFPFWTELDLASIPHPEFVYSDFYARGYTSLTLAAPKVGKSMLGLAEAVDMATGRGFLTGQKRDPLKVVYYNAEDDQSVLNSRVSALLTHYEIPQSELIGQLAPVSGIDHESLIFISGQEGKINETAFIALEKFCEECGADVLIFDPLQDLSTSPETNEVFRLLGQRLRLMASRCHVSLGLIHHTRKVAPGMTATIEDGRGGSALRGTARFNRILNPMTEEEAAKAGVANHRHYLRIGDMESNLAPPSADVNRWFEKKSVLTPNGHEVGVVAAWRWPDAFDGITPQQAAQVRGAIDRMQEPPRADVRARAWVGEIVGDVLGINIAEKGGKARVQALVSGWIKEDVLRLSEHKDARAGRTVQVVICGSNNPLETGGQAQ